MSDGESSVVMDIVTASRENEEAELALVIEARNELADVDPGDVPATFLDAASLGAAMKASGWSQGSAVAILSEAAYDGEAAWSERFKAIDMLDDRVERVMRLSGQLATITTRASQNSGGESTITAEITATGKTRDHLTRLEELQAGLREKRVVDSRVVDETQSAEPAREEQDDE